MGPYNNNKGKPANKLFGQTMRKSNRSSAATRYQRQFGGSSKKVESSNADTSKADEAAARRRMRQEQGELIDAKFGYHRLEDQYQERQKNPSLRTETGAGGSENLMQRRGWLFNMAATTVRSLELEIIQHRLDNYHLVLTQCFISFKLFLYLEKLQS